MAQGNNNVYGNMRNEDGTFEYPMTVHARIDEPGLGKIGWWRDDGEDDEMIEE